MKAEGRGSSHTLWQFKKDAMTGKIDKRKTGKAQERFLLHIGCVKPADVGVVINVNQIVSIEIGDGTLVIAMSNGKIYEVPHNQEFDRLISPFLLT